MGRLLWIGITYLYKNCLSRIPRVMPFIKPRRDCLSLENHGCQIVFLFSAATEILNRKTQPFDNFISTAVVRLSDRSFQSLQSKLFTPGVLPFIKPISNQHDHVVRSQTPHERLFITDTGNHSERNALRLEIFQFASGVLVPENWTVTCGQNFDFRFFWIEKNQGERYKPVRREILRQ